MSLVVFPDASTLFIPKIKPAMETVSARKIRVQAVETLLHDVELRAPADNPFVQYLYRSFDFASYNPTRPFST